MRRLFLLMIGLLILTACGDDGPSLEERSQGYIDAINAGDADAAWEYRSDRCQEQDSKDEMASAIELIGSQYPDVERLDYSETINDSGDQAVIQGTLNYPDLQSDSGTRWVKIDGEWYWDDC